MIALDTSVCIPAVVSWHEHHAASRKAARGAAIPSHAMAETYSVLTRLPSPHRLAGATASALLHSWFPSDRILTSPSSLQRRLVRLLADAELEGGATYDGLIGLTAHHHGLTLLTRDQRAARTYERLGVDYEVLDEG